MITHYGLFWSERDVFWGRQKNPGQLLGRTKTLLARQGAPTKAETEKSVDYRDYKGLYCLYSGEQLVYVGETGIGTNSTLFQRLKQHRTGPLAGRWDRFSWFGAENIDGNVDQTQAFSQLEAIVIAIVNPGFNKQSGAFGVATPVYQVPHEESDGDVETKLERILAKLKSLHTEASKGRA